jgi:DNA-binding MarR family transcriptional regulator
MRTDDDATTGGGPALFRLVRFWSRRWAAGAAGDVTGVPAEARGDRDDAGHVGHVLVLEAIEAAARGGVAQIGEVAVELGLDRSNASRMLAAAVAAGLVTKTVSAHDARRTELAVTPAGAELLAAARAWQEQTFRRLTADWPAADVRRFASYLVRLAEQPAPDPRPGPDRHAGSEREPRPAGRPSTDRRSGPDRPPASEHRPGPVRRPRAGRQPMPEEKP